MAALLSQLRAFHAGLDPARRRVLWGAAVAAVVAVIGVGVWASQPSYVVLTRASDGDEAAAVTRALAEAGLPYRVDTDGLTVRVPAQREIDARRAAAGDGGIVGLEGLERIDPWVTPFQEQLHRQRMLQGELVRTIEGIAGIQAATVQLDLPEPSAFLRDVTRPTAAVTLRPDAGGILDVRTARSVAELVSHAVAGMGAEDVSVVDASSGRTLWGGDRADAGAEGALAVDAAHREAALAASVRSALTTLLGREDAAAVTVRVELESAQVQQTVNAVDPASAVAATERIETEVDTRGSGVASGVPGTDANLAERATTESAGSHTRETQQTSYQFTTTTTTTTTPAGGIRRLSASVIIDSAVLAAANADEAALRDQIQRAVRAALGANETRGDEVVVSFLPFVTAAVAAPVAAPAASPVSTELWGGLAVLLVVAALLARPALRALRPPAPPPVVEEPPAAPIVEAPAAVEAPPAPLDFSARLRGHVDRLEAHQPRAVSDLVRRESAHSAEVVRRWLQCS